jgi:serine/threonine-protein kinase
MWSELSRSGVTSTEEGRAFFQARLANFGMCLFVLAGGTWFILSLVYAISVAHGHPTSYTPFSLGGSLHLSNGLLAAMLWLTTRGRPRNGATLHALDIGTTTGLMMVWSSSGASVPPPVGPFIGLLAFTIGTLARAIVVPSTARRTLVLGVCGTLMLITALFARAGSDPGAIGSAIALGCWASSAVGLATLASHTIFGLRREVREANVLGQYTLETKIGEGGMGAVWRARHALLRRPTAIKLLPLDRMGDEAIRRFEREVQFTARLTHPNSVAIYDYGRTREGIFYYAMELLEGMDLERLVAAHGALPPGRVVHVLSQICGALAEAHDQGLVHRDVKPANVLLSPRRNEHEFAKIVDFGLVKSLDLSSPAPAVSSTQTITGTPLYMAPEAIRTPDAVDARSDLYSLGAVAWFLLVGRPPFEGNSVIEVCSQHLHAAPDRPSSVLGKAVPADLEDIVLACLEKQASDRPSDARVLRDWFLDCSAADLWTVDHATEFWRTHVPSEPSEILPTPRSPRTIALDLGDRMPGDRQ